MKPKNIKPEPTSEEIAEKERVKKVNSESRKLKTKVKKSCQTVGLIAVRLQFEHLKTTPSTKLPSKYLTGEQTIICWNDAIREYEHELTQPGSVRAK
jgi:hypothetical protein